MQSNTSVKSAKLTARSLIDATMKIKGLLRSTRLYSVINAKQRFMIQLEGLLKPGIRGAVKRALALAPRGGIPHDVLRLKSLGVSERCLQLEWRARDVHPWDRDLPLSEQAELFSEQALKDTDAAIVRLFRMLPGIEEIKLQVVKPMAFGGVIFAGVVERGSALAPRPAPSLRQRLITLGVRYKMGGGHLALLPVCSWGPTLNHSAPGLRPACAS